MKPFNIRTLSYKITLPLLGALAISLIFLIYNLSLAHSAQNENREIQEKTLPSYRLLESNLVYLDQVVENLQFAISTQEVSWADQSKKWAEQIRQNLDTLAKKYPNGFNPDTLKQQFELYFDTALAASRMLADPTQADQPIDPEMAQQVMGRYNATRVLFQEAFFAAEQEVDVKIQANSDRTSDMIVSEFLFMLVLLVAFYLTRRHTIKNIVQPINGLMKGTRQIGQGNYTYTIKLKTGDEIEALAESFNQMSGKLQQSIDAISQKQVELEVSNQKLSELNAQLEEKVSGKIKELREKDHLLMQQSRLAAMGEMISNIAHQWRQPLNALGVMLQNLERFHERGKLDSEKMESSVEKGMKLISQMSQTVDDFRDFFKPDKEKRVFSLAEEAASSLELANPMLEHYDVVVYQEMMKEVRVMGFQNELGHCLLNLIQNAKDALKEKNRDKEKWIKISIFQQDGKGCITVQDNGGGIPGEVMPKIFQPYFTTKEEGEGTGIGLYMTKTMIEKHMEGEILVSNTEEGACFEIKLPLHKKEMA